MPSRKITQASSSRASSKRSPRVATCKQRHTGPTMKRWRRASSSTAAYTTSLTTTPYHVLDSEGSIVDTPSPRHTYPPSFAILATHTASETPAASNSFNAGRRSQAATRGIAAAGDKASATTTENLHPHSTPASTNTSRLAVGRTGDRNSDGGDLAPAVTAPAGCVDTHGACMCPSAPWNMESLECSTSSPRLLGKQERSQQKHGSCVSLPEHTLHTCEQHSVHASYLLHEALHAKASSTAHTSPIAESWDGGLTLFAVAWGVGSSPCDPRLRRNAGDGGPSAKCAGDEASLWLVPVPAGVDNGIQRNAIKVRHGTTHDACTRGRVPVRGLRWWVLRLRLRLRLRPRLRPARTDPGPGSGSGSGPVEDARRLALGEGFRHGGALETLAREGEPWTRRRPRWGTCSAEPRDGGCARSPGL